MDMSNFSTTGRLPSGITVLAATAVQPPLTNWNLSHNNLVSFPLVILDVSTLLHLDLSWNMLSSMPSGIIKLAHLQVLNISHNQFTYFPSSILKLKESLLELYLQDNKLEEIRNDFLKLSYLEVLDVSNNRLKTLPSGLNSHMKLKFFRFSGNPVFDGFPFQSKTKNGPTPGVLKFSSTGNIHTTRRARRRLQQQKKKPNR